MGSMIWEMIGAQSRPRRAPAADRGSGRSDTVWLAVQALLYEVQVLTMILAVSFGYEMAGRGRLVRECRCAWRCGGLCVRLL